MPKTRILAAVLVLALSAPSSSWAMAAAGASGGASGGFRPLTAGEIPALPDRPDLAQRQAIGCTVVGLGMTGLALASGATAAAGTGGAAVPVSAMIAELVAYFGAGCTIGAFMGAAFPFYSSPDPASPPLQQAAMP